MLRRVASKVGRLARMWAAYLVAPSAGHWDAWTGNLKVARWDAQMLGQRWVVQKALVRAHHWVAP